MSEERSLQVLMSLLTDDQKSRFRKLCRELNATKVEHEKEIAATILKGPSAVNKLKAKGLGKIAVVKKKPPKKPPKKKTKAKKRTR